MQYSLTKGGFDGKRVLEHHVAAEARMRRAAFHRQLEAPERTEGAKELTPDRVSQVHDLAKKLLTEIEAKSMQGSD